MIYRDLFPTTGLLTWVNSPTVYQNRHPRDKRGANSDAWKPKGNLRLKCRVGRGELRVRPASLRCQAEWVVLSLRPSGWDAGIHSWTSKKPGFYFEGLYFKQGCKREERTCSTKIFCGAETHETSNTPELSWMTAHTGPRETGISQEQHEATLFRVPGSNFCDWHDSSFPSHSRLVNRY